MSGLRTDARLSVPSQYPADYSNIFWQTPTDRFNSLLSWIPIQLRTKIEKGTDERSEKVVQVDRKICIQWCHTVCRFQNSALHCEEAINGIQQVWSKSYWRNCSIFILFFIENLMKIMGFFNLYCRYNFLMYETMRSLKTGIIEE